jgi:serine/threonine protein kinase
MRPWSPALSGESADSITEAGSSVVIGVQPLGPGSLIGSRYELLSILGKGSSGTVYRAFDRLVAQTIAMKVISPRHAGDASFVDRLKVELRHTRRVMHPNVCRVFDIGAEDGHAFLTMELAPGGTLRERLRGRARPLSDRIADARSIVAGLAAIHNAGLLHRDIKPRNVLVMADDRVVISDLGLAVSVESNPEGTIVGTPGYMAPEVREGEPATVAADIWSLGVLLWELFFDERPTENASQGSRPAWRERARAGTGVEMALRRLCEDCLNPAPAKRPRTMIDVQRRLVAPVPGVRRSVIVSSSVTIGLVCLTALATSTGRPPPATLRSEPTRVTPSAAASSGVQCIDQLDGRTIRLISGDPRMAIDYDLVDQSAARSGLLPATFREGCPRLSPDGVSLLFEARDAHGRSAIYLAPNPDGVGAVFIDSGTDPLWLRDGNSFVFQREGQTQFRKVTGLFGKQTSQACVCGERHWSTVVVERQQ